MLLTGKDFNKIYPNKSFIKLTNMKENHKGHQFKTGLNVDSISFNGYGECKPGGIYFCFLENMYKWLLYSQTKMFYIRKVIIPGNALVYIKKNKFKSDRLILDDRDIIIDLYIWKSPSYCTKACKYNPNILLYIKNQTQYICLLAVKQNGWALQFVKKQKMEICLEAVKQNGLALQYVKEQSPIICLEVVKQNVYALQYAKEQTKEICLELVKGNGLALEYVKEQTPEICMEAIKQNGMALCYVKEQTTEICLEAVKQNGLALHYVKEQPPGMIVH